MRGSFQETAHIPEDHWLVPLQEYCLGTSPRLRAGYRTWQACSSWPSACPHREVESKESDTVRLRPELAVEPWLILQKSKRTREQQFRVSELTRKTDGRREGEAERTTLSHTSTTCAAGGCESEGDS